MGKNIVIFKSHNYSYNIKYAMVITKSKILKKINKLDVVGNILSSFEIKIIKKFFSYFMNSVTDHSKFTFVCKPYYIENKIIIRLFASSALFMQHIEYLSICCII